MTSLMLFFILLSTGSVFAAAFWRRRYEELLPVTCAAIVFTLFVFGMLGNLALGAVGVCVLATALYAASAIRVLIKREGRAFIQRVFTPAFFAFVGAYVFLIYCNKGKLAAYWDEFTHWMDILKVMVCLDDFGTNPLADSMFQSYPPGMVLFQYMLQKLNLWTSGALMSEWRAYLAYQVFALSFVFPFLKRLEWKKPFTAVAVLIMICLSPLVFFPDYYFTIYIDPFLGIVFGAGLATVFFYQEEKTLSTVHAAGICLVLVLAKDAGLFLALMIALSFMLVMWFGGKERWRDGWKRKGLVSVAIFGAAVIPHLAWRLHLAVRGAQLMFSTPYDVTALFRVLLGLDDTYLTTVWENFIHALFNRALVLNSFGVGMTYIVACVALATASSALMWFFATKRQELKRTRSMLVPLVAVESVAYLIGMCFTYQQRFTPAEAINLASFERYLFIQFLGVWTFVVILLLVALQAYERSSGVVTATALCVALAIAPMHRVESCLTREDVRYSVEGRSVYTGMSDKINRSVPEDAEICFISQENDGYDYFVLHFDVRPRRLGTITSARWSWSIGELLYEGDYITMPITAEDWQSVLVEKFDYVALFRLNDYFYEHYSTVFASPEDIAEQEVYRVNKETGLLEWCGL